MPKKIFDIIPPQKTKNIKKNREMKTKKKINIKNYLIFVSIFLFSVIGFWAYFSSSQFEIEVWLKSDFLTFEETISVDLETAVLNLKDRVISGKIIDKEINISQEFFSSGKTEEDKHATGTIRVYNEYSTDNVPFIANTRFISSDGKLFTSVKREVIPGKGYVDIEVRAAEPGETYNIGPTTFSIPGLAGTPQYTSFYGKSFENMSGGFKGESSQITEEDLERAKSVLAETANNRNIDNALSEISKDLVLIKDEISKEIIKSNFTGEAGEMKESFTLEITVLSKFIAFKKDEAEILAKEFIEKNIEEDKKIKTDSIESKYYLVSKDKDLGSFFLEAEYSARVYSDINLFDVKNNILGKEREEIKEYIENLSQVERIDITAWPIFRRNVSKSSEKVEIRTNI